MLSRNEVKYIQSLYHKKNRDKEGLFIAEGVKVIDELLSSDFKITKIFSLSDWKESHPYVTNVIEVDEASLNRISNFETPQKVLAIVEQKNTTQLPNLNTSITLILDGIQDPGNLGTIIRTADWFGIKNIIASPDTADVYNPKVVQSTMGSFTRVNMFYHDLETLLSFQKIKVIGAMLDGDNFSELQKHETCLLVIGNESKGIRPYIQAYIQQKITIPKIGNAESLNAAVATGIILWEMLSH
ncbi:MAG: RNA methyltransferase [Bacteroidetes bacterium]|nr:RNA methyltransferase [Bacteroidota bacterium]